MILPEKHVTLSKSSFGFGGFLLQFFSASTTVDGLWNIYSEHNNTSEFNAFHSFDDFILTLDYLFLIGAINQNEKGEIFYEVSKPNCE